LEDFCLALAIKEAQKKSSEVEKIAE